MSSRLHPSGSHSSAHPSGFGSGFAPDRTEHYTQGDTGRIQSASGRRSRKEIGPYLIQEELGRGANGVVYLARHRQLERPIALKVLLPSYLTDEEAVARFKLEAAAASKINDPGVVQVFDIGLAGSYYYYAMEYCAGESLEQRIKKGPLPAEEAAQLVATVARSMAVAHRQGVIHRDLKPANIMLDERTGKPKVTDFGLARDHTLLSMTRTGDVLGTPVYMAPEQILGHKDLDHRVDVYALGVILYQCLTGSVPYMADTLPGLSKAIRSGNATPPSERVSGVPPEIEDACLKAMSVHREDRFRDAMALADLLDGYLRSHKLPGSRDDYETLEDEGVPTPIVVGVALVVVLSLVLAIALATRSGQTETAHEPAPATKSQPAPAPAPQPAVAPAPTKKPKPEPEPEEYLRARARIEQARKLARNVAPLPEILPKLDQALQLATGNKPLRAKIRMQRIHLLCRRLELEKAVRGIDELAVYGPVPLRARYLKALALLQLKRIEPAKVELEALKVAGGPTGHAARALERTHLVDDLAGAAAAAREALEGDGTLVDARVNLGRIHLLRNDGVNAQTQLTAALAAFPDHVQALMLLADLRQAQNKMHEAATVLTRAMTLAGPRTPVHAYFSRSMALLFQPSPDRAGAVSDLNVLLSKQPDHWKALGLRGYIRYLQGKKKLARADFLKARGLNRFGLMGFFMQLVRGGLVNRGVLWKIRSELRLGWEHEARESGILGKDRKKRVDDWKKQFDEEEEEERKKEERTKPGKKTP